MKARVFQEMLARVQTTRANRNEATPEEVIRRKVAQTHHRLQSFKLEPSEESKLLDQLEDLRETWRKLKVNVAQQDTRRSQLFSSQPITVADVQSALDADAVLLEYEVSYEGSILWAVTKEQVRAYTLPSESALQTTLEAYLKSLRQPLIGKDEVSSHAELGRKLYATLLAPATETIRHKKHLIISPDGPLHYLPFEALIISEADDRPQAITSPGSIDYLIKQFEVSYIPSTSVLVAQRGEWKEKRENPELPLLAFGDALYTRTNEADKAEGIADLALRGRGLSPLEFSGEEVLAIARIWGIPSTSSHINLRERATVEQLRKTDLLQYRILHFATHAIVTDQVKMLSQPALVLSQDTGNYVSDGLLQFSDILELKINADLVVRQPAIQDWGRLRDGEGIVGLSRAFLYAGAASAVVSLWKVEDQSTSLLMERFYRKLKEGTSKAQALRQAKLELMQSTANLKATDSKQSFASPFYWAPFVVVGDWRSLVWN